MLQIGDVIVSLDILTEKFRCNPAMCKGECCVDGDAGAPLEPGEQKRLEEVLPLVWGDISPYARMVIIEQGVSYTDRDGEPVTSIVGGKDCVFTCYNADGCCLCSIEKVCRQGKTDFYKPVSCHLYPIRASKMGELTALNYHRWSVCRSAVLSGEKEDVPVYRFLRDPLVRKFGEAWYRELETAAVELKERGLI